MRPMTQADSASSGRASTGGWWAGRQPEGRVWEEKRGVGVAGASTRAEATEG